MVIVVDTNFLLIPGKYKIDIFNELRTFSKDIVVMKQVMGELEKIADSKGNAGSYARIALELVRREKDAKRLRIVGNSISTVDKAILTYAKGKSKTDYCAVATNDRDLLKLLKASDIRRLRLRQEKYVEEE